MPTPDASLFVHRERVQPGLQMLDGLEEAMNQLQAAHATAATLRMLQSCESALQKELGMPTHEALPHNIAEWEKWMFVYVAASAEAAALEGTSGEARRAQKLTEHLLQDLRRSDDSCGHMNTHTHEKELACAFRALNALCSCAPYILHMRDSGAKTVRVI